MHDSVGQKLWEVPVGVIGMAAGAADAAFNVASLGGKSIAEGGAKELIKAGVEELGKDGAKAGEKETVKAASEEAKTGGKLPGTTVDPTTGQKVQRFVVDPKGNTMIEPAGGTTKKWGRGGADTHTTYPNGSPYQRLDNSHGAPHGHGQLPGTGPGKAGTGPSLDPSGNVVPNTSPGAHWPVK